jgi:nucleotide-binding universal stress UspA family protein
LFVPAIAIVPLFGPIQIEFPLAGAGSNSSYAAERSFITGFGQMAISHILVATDGSPGASRAVIAAAELAKALDGDLLIVTLAEKISITEINQLVQSERGIPEALDLLAARILAEAKELAANVGPLKVRTCSGSGEVAEGIIDLARREHTDIIVVGRRGRGQLAGLLLGSVSHKLVSLAPSLVLVVP